MTQSVLYYVAILDKDNNVHVFQTKHKDCWDEYDMSTEGFIVNICYYGGKYVGKPKVLCHPMDSRARYMSGNFIDAGILTITEDSVSGS